MRPSDENQAASKRPNLISNQRRASGEINILAMLEGQTGRPLKRRLTALPAALWYGGAGVLACALVGTLVWLAHDAGPSQPVQPTLASDPVPAPVHAPEPEPETPLISAPAPLPAAAPVLVTEAPAVAAATPVPAPSAPALATAPASATPRPQPARAATAIRPPAVHAAARPLTIAHVTPPRARRANPAVRARPAAPEPDTDVALISAIIQHGAPHPPAPGEGCADRPCPAVLSDQP